jgi:subtilisin family serine protease
MNKAVWTLGVSLVLACTLVFALPGHAGGANGGPKRVIVVLKDSVASPSSVAEDHSRRLGANVEFVYEHALKGYAAVIPNDRVAAVRSDSRVAYIEDDVDVEALAQTLPWGIDYIDADASSTAAGNGSGTVGGVNVYVIDTGIGSHADLNLVAHVNFAGGRNMDCNGHGTHVAGTIAARDDSNDVVGVAPGAPLTGVKVLNCNGSGRTSGVIKGIDWVTGNAKKPAIANMSLGGGASSALDDAVRRSVASGVVYAVAAGNSGADACTQSPARAGTTSGVLTTGAIDSSGAETSWSNYGSCVDVWAPGAGIVSTRLGGGTTTMSGTSMASPHVAGTAALYLSTHPGTSPAAVETALRGDAYATGGVSKDGRPLFSVYAGGY